VVKSVGLRWLEYPGLEAPGCGAGDAGDAAEDKTEFADGIRMIRPPAPLLVGALGINPEDVRR
jgi:hypothetical protein